MIGDLFSIFFSVIAPVFGVVIIGYLAAKPLGLEAHSLSRSAYFIFIPCFIFDVLSSAEVSASLVLRMLSYITVVHLAIALLALIIARLLGHNSKMAAAYIIIGVFGNVGNFGLPLITFRLGDEAVLPATIYFLGILTVAFVICVGAANYVKGGSLSAVIAVIKTPALLAIPPALLVNVSNIDLPLVLTRITGLLGSAMIPIMLLSLGVQLAGSERIALERDMVIASAIRLIGSPALALLLVAPFGLTGIERGAGIFQSGMPAAVLCSIIALEHDLLPDFVTKTVLFSTIGSVFTLTILLAVV